MGWSRDTVLNVARRTGYPVIEAWSSHNAGLMGTVVGAMMHHTGSSNPNNADYPTLKTVRDGRSDLNNSLCMYGLGKSGTIYCISEKISWHAGVGSWNGVTDGNGHFAGIEAESSGNGRDWTPQQIDAYQKLVASILIEVGHGTNWAPAHKEFALPAGRKVDTAGIDLNAFRGAVQRYLDNPSLLGVSGGPIISNGFPLGPGNYFGLITGPAESHGGANAQEKGWVAQIQRKLQDLGFAPKTAGWADGIFEQATADAVAAWQRAAMPGTTRFGEVWSDDWAKLFAPPPPPPLPPGPPIEGAILDAYRRPGIQQALGAAKGPEVPTTASDPVGRWQEFEHGVIYWHPNVDGGNAHVVLGAILEKWTEMGREVATGFPTTDESTTPDGVGKFNHFDKGNSIYWHPSTGAWPVGGAIGGYWAANGWETGPLGYPKSAEYPAHDDVIGQDWQHGVTLWMDGKVFVWLG